MKKKLKRHYIIISFLLIIVLAIVFYFTFGKKTESLYEFVTVERGALTQEVSVTGRVQPAEDVDLAFERAGKISGVYVKVGDKVYSGQLLVQLSNSDVVAQLDGAKADLKAQQAKLEELKRGTRPEEIQVQEVKVENARVALNDAQKNLDDKLKDAYTKSDDAIRGKVDQFFNNPRSSNPQLAFSLSDSALKSKIESGRVRMENILTAWQASSAGDNLNEVKAFLDNIALAVNTLTSSDGETWKTNVSTARTNINTAIVNLSAAEEGYSAANSDLTLVQQELELEKAGTVKEQITAQEAQVEKAGADMQKYQADLSKTIIKSPIKGVVSKQEAEVGEIVSANSLVVSVISESNFEIEANIPEMDIGKITKGESAKVTLDAYGEGVVFDAFVSKIDPAETVIEGVATYKTTLQFSKSDDRLKSGMTANIDILTAERKNVLFVPQRAVIQQNGNNIVRIVTSDGVFEERPVQTGLKASDGSVEIFQGLEEGDKVITFIK